eukprot:COSAG01_NODE_71553_length_255_cov_1.294872_1_plen_52_part_01
MSTAPVDWTLTPSAALTETADAPALDVDLIIVLLLTAIEMESATTDALSAMI